MNFYAIYDTAIQQYLQPFLAHNNATAIRALTEDLRRPDTYIKTPTDYALYHVGKWNKDTGEITPQQPQQICPLNALVPKDKE